MKLVINGAGRELEGVRTLKDVLIALGYEGNHFAVALNRSCVHRRELEDTQVSENDLIEILAPMQGG